MQCNACHYDHSQKICNYLQQIRRYFFKTACYQAFKQMFRNFFLFIFYIYKTISMEAFSRWVVWYLQKNACFFVSLQTITMISIHFHSLHYFYFVQIFLLIKKKIKFELMKIIILTWALSFFEIISERNDSMSWITVFSLCSFQLKISNAPALNHR